jgi:hypothetical protein
MKKEQYVMKQQETKKGENAESIADLEIDSAQAEEIQAGAGQTFSAYPGFLGGVNVAAADVNGGYFPKATDVTLKRGVID